MYNIIQANILPLSTPDPRDGVKGSKLFSSDDCHFAYQIKGIKHSTKCTKIVSEYDQEIPQSQTADNPLAPRGRVAQPSQDTRKTN